MYTIYVHKMIAAMSNLLFNYVAMLILYSCLVYITIQRLLVDRCSSVSSASTDCFFGASLELVDNASVTNICTYKRSSDFVAFIIFSLTFCRMLYHGTSSRQVGPTVRLFDVRERVYSG